VKQTALRVFRETLAAINIQAALERKLDCDGKYVHVDGRTVNLSDFSEFVAIAIGKAAFPMAEALINVLPSNCSPEGVLVAPAPPARGLPGWKTLIGGHPIPTEASFVAGRAILDRLARCDERTLIFFLVSGGGSALVEQALNPSVTHEDFEKLNQTLVTCGAPIEEINVVRKHLSATKGGRLAAAAPLSTKLTLGVSDVPQGHESALASGPTLPDPTTVSDAQRIVARYHLLPTLPPSIREIFEKQLLQETPKESDPAFRSAHFSLLLGAHDLLHAAHHALEGGGIYCIADNTTDNWPVEKAADHLLSLLESTKSNDPKQRCAIVANGEVSSPVAGNGIGGRNSAFVLACAPKIAGKNITVLSAGTDGIDGNSPAAGAVADGETLARARTRGFDPMDFQKRSDAFNFFSALDDAIVIGPTGNNLRDLRILIAH
jgi:hydroxypyruvate reductase